MGSQFVMCDKIENKIYIETDLTTENQTLTL